MLVAAVIHEEPVGVGECHCHRDESSLDRSCEGLGVTQCCCGCSELIETGSETQWPQCGWGWFIRPWGGLYTSCYHGTDGCYGLEGAEHVGVERAW